MRKFPSVKIPNKRNIKATVVPFNKTNYINYKKKKKNLLRIENPFIWHLIN
jgi:hypothetical protein